MSVAGLAVLLVAFGVAVGATGIGGVGVVPALVSLAGMPVETAVPTAQLAFFFAAFVGTFMYRVRIAEAGLEAALLAGAAAAGAAVGALLLPLLAGAALEIALGCLMVAAGGLDVVRAPPAAARAPGRMGTAVLGFAVGTGSALTGTGGPILLVPVLMLLGTNPRRTVALAQAVQIPIAGAASAVHIARGAVDGATAALVAACLAAGVVAGALGAQALPVRALRHALSAVLVAGGVAFLWVRT